MYSEANNAAFVCPVCLKCNEIFKNDKWFSVPHMSALLKASSEVAERSPAEQEGLARFSSCVSKRKKQHYKTDQHRFLCM